MRIRRTLFWTGGALALAATAWCTAVLHAQGEANKPANLARQAASDDPAVSGPAIAALRAQGPAGLQALQTTFAGVLKSHRSPGVSLASYGADPAWQRLTAALDAVGQQRDDYASGLYWYTDLEQAKQAAKASGKPILSLRLLGNLDEELSCANSRFFRSALYPNAEVSRYLRDHFILHWKSVRPAPKVTIDFGDGRKLETTITGNSIHYVLDTAGRPLDALPGLYGPSAFLRELKQDVVLAQRLSRLPVAEQPGALRDYHQARLAVLRAQWKAEVTKVSPETARALAPVTPAQAANANALPAITKVSPTAVGAAPRAISKMVIERPLLAAITPDVLPSQLSIDNPIWSKLAPLYRQDARLDANSLALIRRKVPDGAMLTPAGGVVTASGDGFTAMVQNFETSIALDTARNQYVLHSQIHDWFVNGIATANLDSLNEKVYAELFLTPRSDRWLGLLPVNVYSALPNGGIVKP